MMSRCSQCKKVVRINEHRVFLAHTMFIERLVKGKICISRVVCKGSFTKTVFIEP